MGLRDLLRPVEGLRALDPLADRLGATVTRFTDRGSLKSVLSGTWLGHPVHPVLSDLPIGLFTGATLVDLLGGEDAGGGADLLTVLGLLSVAPTAVTGLSDWADTAGPERRLGLLHALANAGGSAFFTGALLSRRGGNRRLGRLLSLAGLGALTLGGYIGGDLVFTRGVGVDHTLFDETPSEWTRVARDDQIPEDSPTLVTAAGYGVLLYRRGGSLFALGDRCSHAGGPLHEGDVDEDLCVSCPWHGSRFRLTDGSVVRGPATAPQPAFEVRVREGNVEVRERQEG